VRSYCECKRSIFDEEDAGPEQIDLRADYFHTRRWGFSAALFCRDRRMKLALFPRGMRRQHAASTCFETRLADGSAAQPVGTIDVGEPSRARRRWANDAYGAIHKRDEGFDRAKTRRAARGSEPGSANSEEGRGAGGRPLRPRGASLVGSGSPRGRPTLSPTRAASSRIMSARSSSPWAGSCTQTLKPPPSATTHPTPPLTRKTTPLPLSA
jgi:hypothetical protein